MGHDYTTADARARALQANVIYPPDSKRHACDLPDERNVPRMTIARCLDCGRWAYTDVVDTGMGGAFAWLPVRFYDFRLRRRIRKHERESSS